MTRKSSGFISVDHALYALLLVSVTFVAWSVHRYQKLEERLVKTTFDLGHPRVGEWIPSTDLPVLQSPASIAKIGAPERDGQVLYFFSPDCQFCRASTEHVERIHDIIRAHGDMEMYAVSVMNEDETRQYLSETGSKIPTVVLPGSKEIGLYRLNVVPMLLMVDRDGRVRTARYGQLTDKDVPLPSPARDDGQEGRAGVR